MTGGSAKTQKARTTAKATAIDKSLRLRLCSGLRQSGSRFCGGGFDAGLKPRSTLEAKATATAKNKYRDLSTAAAAPPPVEMTYVVVGLNLKKTTATVALVFFYV
jgi:hypothetical protein